MGSKHKSLIPTQEKSSLTNQTSGQSTTNSTNFGVLKSGQNSSQVSSRGVPLFTEPLTPLHRLRRFKAVRDKNLRKSTRISIKPKMSVDIEKDDNAVSESGSRRIREMKAKKEKQEKVRNGNHENVDKINYENVEEKIVSNEEKSEVNGSEENTTSNKQSVEEPKVKPEKFEAKKDNTEKSEAKKDNTEKNEAKKDNTEKNEAKKDNTEKSNKTDLQKKPEEKVSDPFDVFEFKLDIDDIEEVAVVEDVDKEADEQPSKPASPPAVADNEENHDTDYESSNDEVQAEKVKILRRSYRQQILRDTASTSKQVDDIVEQPREKKSLSLSPETVRRLTSTRIQGRRCIYPSQDSLRKRKYSDYFSSGYEVSEKKQAVNRDQFKSSTPSVSSPGWKFISSPFTRFWTPTPSTPQGVTPYKSLPTYSRNDNEDSLAVNVDDTSFYDKLNDSEFDIVDVKNSNSTKNNNWLCNIM